MRTDINTLINTMEREAVLAGDLPMEGVRYDEVLPGYHAVQADDSLGMVDGGFQDDDYETI